MENRRGLFITNVIGKLFEKVKLIDQREVIEEKISKYQTGGIKGKSTADNIMVLNAIIETVKHTSSLLMHTNVLINLT